MLAKTPVIQCSPCFSAVSALFTNPLPDRSNYSPPLPHPTSTTSLRINTSLVSSGQTLYQASPLETNTSMLHALLQNLVENSGEMQCLEEAEQQAEVSVDVPYPPLQIVNSVPFCLLFLYLYPISAPFLNPLSSPSPPSLLSLLINSLSS